MDRSGRGAGPDPRIHGCRVLRGHRQAQRPVAESSPHGAGRAHSRSAAKRLLTREDLDARMDGIARGHSDAFLDEHPDAYNSIDIVMPDAADLVSIDRPHCA
jgi:RNA-splicing ligase RtcB